MALAKVTVRVLGSVDLVDAAGEVRRIPGRRAQRLLSRLICDADRNVTVDALVEAVWADGVTSGPVAALQTQVFRLRRLLAIPGAPGIATTATGYQLELGEATTDVLEFERAVRSAATAEPAAAADLLEAALDLWRGPAFVGGEDVESLRSEQIRLDELHAQAVEQHAAALVETGRANQAIARLEPFLAESPLRTQACATLMRALAAVGRDADAVRVFQEHRRHLVEELGLEPSPGLRRLEASIVRGELAVDAEPDRLDPIDPLDEAASRPGGPTIDTLSIKVLSRPGMRLAWAELGTGPPVLVVPAWVSSLDVIVAGRDPRSALIERLAERHRVITYDRRGTGLSGGEVADFGIDAAVDELEAMVEVVGRARGPRRDLGRRAHHRGLRRSPTRAACRTSPCSAPTPAGRRPSATSADRSSTCSANGRAWAPSCWPASTGRARRRRPPCTSRRRCGTRRSTATAAGYLEAIYETDVAAPGPQGAGAGARPALPPRPGDPVRRRRGARCGPALRPLRAHRRRLAPSRQP